jgi:hypothetical protein
MKEILEVTKDLNISSFFSWEQDIQAVKKGDVSFVYAILALNPGM